MTSSPVLSPGRIVVTGILSLAIAMGIGRFAFTPLLPMMLHDGLVDLPRASWLASANYLGYLVGALLCTFQPLIWRRVPGLPPVQGTAMVRLGLAATCVLTLGMALYLPAVWPLLRFIAGVASALVFIYCSGWCLGQLSRLDVPAMGALIYIGPGGGIVLSGLAASGMVALQGSAATGWAVFGVLALVLTALIWPAYARQDALPAAAPATPAAAVTRTAAVTSAAAGPGGAAHHGAVEMGLLTVAYGFAGFGYIITATFLPVIARQSLPGSAWLDLFWPLFGLGVMTGAVLASRVRNVRDLRWPLVGCYAVQALGIGIGLWSPSLPGFAFGSLLLGLPFTAITYFAMQEVRRVKPLAASAYMGLVTTMYGLGQIAGPPLAAWLLARSASPARGFELSLEIAAASLLLGAAIYAAMTRLYPVKP